MVALLNEACGAISRRLGYPGAVAAGCECVTEMCRCASAWVMKLKPGNEAIYKQKHDEIWPEMLALMARDGIRNYSIYRHGLTLFAYLERDTPPDPAAPIEPIVWRWWEMMAP